MTRTRPANEDALPSSLRQLKQMIDGSQSEIDLGRSHSSGTLSVSGAVRAVDLICDAELGEHSTAANHRDATELLATIPGEEHLVGDFSLCQSRKTEFNYHASELTIEDAREVLEAARHLASEAVGLLTRRGWFPNGESPTDYDFGSAHMGADT
ncbi:MAG: hypothetical protein Q8L08_04565 [Candidatus Nanopelagicaceae bacterium]|nr:hypothetical protein [Candidatus Nanopelagicaceae bacterium]